MKTLHTFLFIVCAMLFFAVSCSDDDPVATDEDENNVPVEIDDPVSGDDLKTNSVEGYTVDNGIYIAFADGATTVTNNYNDVAITTDGSNVTIRSSTTSTEYNYVLSGVTKSGSVKFYGEYKFGIHLNGVAITNPSGPAINNQCGKKTTVTVVSGTFNQLVDGTSYTIVDGEDMKAALFSEGQLQFYGTGELQVYGYYKHAICSDDYIGIYQGNIGAQSSVSDAIHANDCVDIQGGSLTTVSSGEGIDSEGYVTITGGTISISTKGEKAHGIKTGTTVAVDGTPSLFIAVTGSGSKCISSTGDITISAGTLNLKTSGSAFYDTTDKDISSPAGIKGDANAVIKGGAITIACSGNGNKGININGTLEINDAAVINVTNTGSTFKYNSSLDSKPKGIKSDGIMTVNGGAITITTTKTDGEGMECETTMYVKGGTIEINAYDDCINTQKAFNMSGGYVYCLSSGDDAIDSNGTITISGGTIIAAATATMGDGIDCDQNTFTITGGTMIGIGGGTSSPTTSACKQHSVRFSPTGSSSVSTIRIESTTGGTEALSFKLPATFSGSQLVLLFSGSSLAANTGYTIKTGGTISGGTQVWHGYYTGAGYSDGTSQGTFTTPSSGYTTQTVGTTSNQGGMGGQGGPR